MPKPGRALVSVVVLSVLLVVVLLVALLVWPLCCAEVIGMRIENDKLRRTLRKATLDVITNLPFRKGTGSLPACPRREVHLAERRIPESRKGIMAEFRSPDAPDSDYSPAAPAPIHLRSCSTGTS
jgi:hypothetical protein